MNTNHGENERELYRTYLRDLADCVASLWGGDEKPESDQVGGLPTVLIFLAANFVFWSCAAGYFIYIWFIR